jgi:hypothetical protein
MPIIAKLESNFEKAPVGMQQAVCAFVHDIGTQVSEYQGKTNIHRQVIISWELAEKMTTGENEGKPFMVSKYYTLSLNEKARLRKDLESWRGKSFSENDLDGFDLEKLVGVNCFLNITATENDKRKITAITPLAKGMQSIQIVNVVPSEKFSAWIERERAKSLEMRGEQGQNHVADTTDKDNDSPF